MFDLDRLQEIWLTITRNKFRSVLTGFGVFWGIFLLIVLIGFGNAFEGGFKKNLSDFLYNSTFFYSNSTSVPYKGHPRYRYWQMDNKDLLLIREKSISVDKILPSVRLNNSPKNNVVFKQKVGTSQVQGIHQDQHIVDPQIVLAGRLINELDLEQIRKVCLIEKELADVFFTTEEEAIGSSIKVNGVYFTIVGVVKSKTQGNMFGMNNSSTVFLPISTMQVVYNMGTSFHSLTCTAKPSYNSIDVENEVSRILKEAHDIAPEDPTALYVFSMEKNFKLFKNLNIGASVLIWMVGLGALLSGIIGISNIMLVSVKERTNEIGIRRALGAKPGTIFLQVITESVVLTSISGVIGFLLGVGLIGAIESAMSHMIKHPTFFEPPSIPFIKAVLSLAILVLSGLFSGLLPAFRAIKIKPIDAIREE